MRVVSRQIRSDPDPASPRPWYDLEADLQARQVSIVNDRDGGTEFDMTGAAASVDSVDPTEPARLAVTAAGSLIAYKLDTNAPPLRAHLAEWDGTDTLTVLEFVE